MTYLEDLAQELGVEIVYDKLATEDFSVKSGLCRVKDSHKIFLDRSEAPESRINILAKALSAFNTENIYLRPHIRDILEKARKSL